MTWWGRVKAFLYRLFWKPDREFEELDGPESVIADSLRPVRVPYVQVRYDVEEILARIEISSERLYRLHFNEESFQIETEYVGNFGLRHWFGEYSANPEAGERVNWLKEGF